MDDRARQYVQYASGDDVWHIPDGCFDWGEMLHVLVADGPNSQERDMNVVKQPTRDSETIPYPAVSPK